VVFLPSLRRVLKIFDLCDVLSIFFINAYFYQRVFFVDAYFHLLSIRDLNGIPAVFAAAVFAAAVCPTAVWPAAARGNFCGVVFGDCHSCIFGDCVRFCMGFRA
jgi:hypothetical protein